MDFDEYVAARHGRLIEHAVRLGCAEEEAPAYVDRVLAEHRRQIRRAEDPDPVVVEALQRGLAGVPRWRPGALSVLGAAMVAVAAVGTLATRPAPEPVPSLFALSGSQATQLLERQGYRVELLGTGACEPEGLVIGSEPASGQGARPGATVTVRTARPSESTCHGQYDDRRAAWRFVSFALGGPEPELADDVQVVVDGRPSRWAAVSDLVAEAARRPASTTTGMPALRVSSRVPPAAWCDVPRPRLVGDREALRIELDRATRNDEGVCPLTLDLYRTGTTIDAVVAYSAKYQSGELTFAGVP